MMNSRIEEWGKKWVERFNELLTSSLRTPKIFVEEFCDFLVPCH